MNQKKNIRQNNKIQYILFTGIILILLAMVLPVSRADTAGLPTRGNPGMAYDSESDIIVVFGGWNNTDTPYSSTWIFDYNSDTYTKRTPSPTPRRRAEPGIIYDSLRDMIVLFGGRENFTDAGDLGDSWTYDYNTDTWTRLFPVSSPSARRAMSMSYDSESDRIILFGGQSGVSVEVYYNETWVGNPGSNTWQKMSPVLAPPARMSYGMAYDSESDRTILFGGYSGSIFFNDTWAYDYNTNTWEELTNPTHPSPRGAHTMTYDSESDRIVLFGGSRLSVTFDDTWIYDYNTNSWVEQNPSVSPIQRSRHGAAYDSESDRVIIYGGTTGGFNSQSHIFDGKTWAYDVNSDTWTQIDQGPPPGPGGVPGYSIVLLIGSLSIIVVILSKRIKKMAKSE
ncbi:MAG: Kelch repeat-containing protein [Candidatus Hermodarchaeota archaeon]